MEFRRVFEKGGAADMGRGCRSGVHFAFAVGLGERGQVEARVTEPKLHSDGGEESTSGRYSSVCTVVSVGTYVRGCLYLPYGSVSRSVGQMQMEDGRSKTSGPAEINVSWWAIPDARTAAGAAAAAAAAASLA